MRLWVSLYSVSKIASSTQPQEVGQGVEGENHDNK